MKSAVMNNVQQNALVPARARWQMAAGAPSSLLRTGRHASVLCVRAGRVWVTLPAQGGLMAQDAWLEAGQTLRLPAGQSVWVDGWPSADVSLHELSSQPQLAPALLRWVGGLTGRWGSSIRPVMQRIGLARAPACTGPCCS